MYIIKNLFSNNRYIYLKNLKMHEAGEDLVFKTFYRHKANKIYWGLACEGPILKFKINQIIQ